LKKKAQLTSGNSDTFVPVFCALPLLYEAMTMADLRYPVQRKMENEKPWFFDFRS